MSSLDIEHHCVDVSKPSGGKMSSLDIKHHCIVLMFKSQAAKCHYWTQTVPLPAGCKQRLSLLLRCTPSVVAV